MTVIGVFAIALAVSLSDLAAVVLLSLGAVYYALFGSARRFFGVAAPVSDRPGPAKFQVKIGRAMIVIAVFAILLATTPTWISATIMFSFIVNFYALYRFILPGPPLPQRHPATKPGFPDDVR